jgi:hypothetical protein
MLKKTLSAVLILLAAMVVDARGQAETLSNADIAAMTKAGLSREVIARKVKDSKGSYDTSVDGLIELKKAGVADEIIVLMLDRKTDAPAPAPQSIQPAALSESAAPPASRADVRSTIDLKTVSRPAKTIAITKSSLNPSLPALEKELLKRKEWKSLNLSLMSHKPDADLYIEIGFVPLSIITHRYVFRVYDNKSGTVLAAGETTSWGSLAENLAREISKKLVAVL